MAFGPDSPLRKLPAGLDPKQRIFFDAIRYSGQMISIAYARLQGQLLKGSATFNDAGKMTSFEAIFLDVWSIVDAVHRFSHLINNTPRISHRGPKIRIFEEKTDGIEDLRHGVQHLGGTINELVKLNMPAFGVLSWAYVPDPSANICFVYTLLSGSIVKSGGHHIVNPAGREFRPPIDHIELAAFGNTVNLSDVYRAVESLAESLENELRPQILEHPNLASDACIAMKCQFGGEIVPVETQPHSDG